MISIYTRQIEDPKKGMDIQPLKMCGKWNITSIQLIHRQCHFHHLLLFLQGLCSKNFKTAKPFCFKKMRQLEKKGVMGWGG